MQLISYFKVTSFEDILWSGHAARFTHSQAQECESGLYELFVFYLARQKELYNMKDYVTVVERTIVCLPKLSHHSMSQLVFA